MFSFILKFLITIFFVISVHKNISSVKMSTTFKTLTAFLLFLSLCCTLSQGINIQPSKPGGGQQKQQCEPIKIPLCKGMKYTLTSMPNHFGQASQEDAIVDLAQYQALANVNCSAELQLFLCSMYTPICIQDYTNDIPVCRAVCERVKAG